MDLNEYLVEILVRDRLADMRAQGEQSHRIQALKPESRSLRLALGQVLIRMRHRLQGVLEPPAAATDPDGAGESRMSTHGAVRG